MNPFSQNGNLACAFLPDGKCDRANFDLEHLLGNYASCKRFRRYLFAVARKNFIMRLGFSGNEVDPLILN